MRQEIKCSMLLSLRVQICLLSSVEFLCLAWRNDAVWFLYLVLKFILIKSPDEWATTKQACRDELVVYLSVSPIYIYIYIYKNCYGKRGRTTSSEGKYIQ